MVGNISRRRALILEYDGTRYSGWQYQANAVTIQQTLEEAAKSLLQQEISVKGASRTDSGVHARGQVASLDLPRPFAGDLAAALNWHLPQDIRIVRTLPVTGDFNPQTWAKGKIYNYFICNRPQPPALIAPYCWHQPKPLDIAAMNSAANYCLGRHDFASFQAAGSMVANTIRTIRHFFCRRRGNLVIVTCCGDGFLYNMVRILVGTLVEIGLAKRSPHHFKDIMEAGNRSAAGPTAPAKGLILEKVLYRPSLDSYRPL